MDCFVTFLQNLKLIYSINSNFQKVFFFLFFIFNSFIITAYNFFPEQHQALDFFWHLKIPTLKICDQKFTKNIKIVILDTEVYNQNLFFKKRTKNNQEVASFLKDQSNLPHVDKIKNIDKSIEPCKKDSTREASKNRIFQFSKKNHATLIKEYIQQITTDVDIVSIPIFNEQGFSSKNKLLEGLKKALKLKPDILYLGLKIHNFDQKQKKIDQKIKSLLARYKYVVVAAGNDASTESQVAFPADCEHIFFSVGAFEEHNNQYKICDFSQFTKNIGPNFVMPGKNIGCQSGFSSGTSAAGALFTGCLAVVLQLTDNHFLQVEIQKIIQHCSIKYTGEGWQERVLFGTPDIKKIERVILKLKDIKNVVSKREFTTKFDYFLKRIIEEDMRLE